VIGSIIQAMTRESQTVAARDGKTVRASHAKSTGLLKGELRVLDGLPQALAQGLFAKPGAHPVVVRLAQGLGEVLSDSVSTHRGMAITRTRSGRRGAVQVLCHAGAVWPAWPK